jgi:hypothetical protein
VFRNLKLDPALLQRKNLAVGRFSATGKFLSACLVFRFRKNYDIKSVSG